MQKTVVPSPKILLGVVDSETDGHGGMVVVALLCRESVVNCSFAAAYQLNMHCVCPATRRFK